MTDFSVFLDFGTRWRYIVCRKQTKPGVMMPAAATVLKGCVPCAVSRTANTVSMVSNVGPVTELGFHKVFNEHIKAAAQLVTDQAKAYSKFAKANRIRFISLKAGHTRAKGIYRIQHINNYHK